MCEALDDVRMARADDRDREYSRPKGPTPTNPIRKDAD
jgi:hypothetical protein